MPNVGNVISLFTIKWYLCDLEGYRLHTYELTMGCEERDIV